MPDIFDLLRKWWKQFLAVILLSLLLVGIITFLKPRQFLSVTTALPSSAFAADKSTIFNEKIQILYSNLGTPDDLDMILGTGRLDTVYLQVADQFNLFDHYKMKGGNEELRNKAAGMLKKNTRVMKSEYGELKVKVWDTDKNLAPQLANAIMDELQVIHTTLKSATNAFALKGLQDGLKKINNDSTGNMQGPEETKKLISDRIIQYEKLISEYQLMVDSKPPALIIVEKAKASSYPDRPHRLQIMIATAILSFLFSLLALVYLERRKNLQAVNTFVNKEKVPFILLAVVYIVFVSLAAFTGNYIWAALPFLILLGFAGWHFRNLFFFILLFSLPFSFEYHFTLSLGTDIPDEGLMLVVSFLFLAGWIYSPGLISKKIRGHPLLIFLLIAFCWTGLSALFSTNPDNSFKFLLAKSWYAGAFVLAPLIVFREKRSITFAALALIISLLAVVLVVLFRHQSSGFSFAAVNEAVYPFFRNHVNYSAMLACSSPLLFAFFYLSKKRWVRFFIIGVFLLVLIALFFSYSRGAWLALLAGTLAYLLIKKRILLITYILLIGFCLGGLFWLKSNDRYLRYAPDFNTTIFHTDFREHLIATYTLKDVSTEERFNRWIAGVRMIKDNWLTGYGPNSFYENYKTYAVPAYKTWVSDNKDHSTVHNYFLLTAIEQGIPGLLFLLLLFGAMLKYAELLYHRVKEIFYKTVALTTGVILTMILVVNFLSDLIETDKIGSLFFLCLATLIVVDINTRKPLNQ